MKKHTIFFFTLSANLRKFSHGEPKIFIIKQIHVKLESNFVLIGHIVLQGVSENYPLGELEACRELLNKDWNCELGHIYDEMHLVVEELANLNSLGPVYFAQTPTSCHLLVSDVKISIPCDVLL